MSDGKIIRLNSPCTPDALHDVLKEVLREGTAGRLLSPACEVEVSALLERYRDENIAKGLSRLVNFGIWPDDTTPYITTNPIKFTFATARLRTDKVRRCCLSRESIHAMWFILVKTAERYWRKLHGRSHITGHRGNPLQGWHGERRRENCHLTKSPRTKFAAYLANNFQGTTGISYVYSFFYGLKNRAPNSDELLDWPTVHSNGRNTLKRKAKQDVDHRGIRPRFISKATHSERDSWSRQHIFTQSQAA